MMLLLKIQVPKVKSPFIINIQLDDIIVLITYIFCTIALQDRLCNYAFQMLDRAITQIFYCVQTLYRYETWFNNFTVKGTTK